MLGKSQLGRALAISWHFTRRTVSQTVMFAEGIRWRMLGLFILKKCMKKMSGRAVELFSQLGELQFQVVGVG